MRSRVELYRKLKGFLAVQEFFVFTAAEPKRRKRIQACEFSTIRWMPKLTLFYRRLTLKEFIKAYYAK